VNNEGIVIAAGKSKCGPFLGSGRRRRPAETCDFDVVHAIEVFTAVLSNVGGMSTAGSVLQPATGLGVACACACVGMIVRQIIGHWKEARATATYPVRYGIEPGKS
jgi:hypothetical protein